MARVSSLATGFAGISIAQIADFVSWGLNGFPAGKYPTDAPMLIAVALAVLAHALYNRFTVPKVPNENAEKPPVS